MGSATLPISTTASNMPENWQSVKRETFTDNDLVDAYLHGKQVGRNEKEQIIASRFRENLLMATEAAESFLKQLRKFKIGFSAIHLKPEGITKFKALFVVDPEDFLSDNFRSVYTQANQLTRQIEKDDFYLSFSFVGNTKSLNESCIKSDGYILKYDKKHRKTQSRSA